MNIYLTPRTFLESTIEVHEWRIQCKKTQFSSIQFVGGDSNWRLFYILIEDPRMFMLSVSHTATYPSLQWQWRAPATPELSAYNKHSVHYVFEHFNVIRLFLKILFNLSGSNPVSTSFYRVLTSNNISIHCYASIIRPLRPNKVNSRCHKDIMVAFVLPHESTEHAWGRNCAPRYWQKHNNISRPKHRLHSRYCYCIWFFKTILFIRRTILTLHCALFNKYIILEEEARYWSISCNTLCFA